MIEYVIAVSLSVGIVLGFLLGRFLRPPDPEGPTMIDSQGNVWTRTNPHKEKRCQKNRT
jgi:hypothetical protein